MNERMQLWRELWRRDPARALEVAERIIASRPLPPLLLARLRVTSQDERRTRIRDDEAAAG